MLNKRLLLLASSLLLAAPMARAAFQMKSVDDEPVFNYPEINQGVPVVAVPQKPAAQSDIWATLGRFKRHEFREWADDMAIEQLKALDRFAKLWGASVTVSGSSAALGRKMGKDKLSQHNIDRWGEVRATDVFPKGLTPQNAEYAVTLAKKAGFSGIGVYLDTSKPMMHLDVRPDRSPFNPASWARIKGEYVGIERAFA